jgi:hypothetical protein
MTEGVISCVWLLEAYGYDRSTAKRSVMIGSFWYNLNLRDFEPLLCVSAGLFLWVKRRRGGGIQPS